MNKYENKINDLQVKKDNNEIKVKEQINQNLEESNNINLEYNVEEKNVNQKEKSENNEIFDYNALYSDKILGRFSLQDKLLLINKLNIIVYGKIKKELLMELKRKRFENKLLIIKSRYKTHLILQKRLHSLIQEKMLRDFYFKKNLKDLRKKLMDEKIEKLKYKNLVFVMKSYGIYREEKYFRSLS